MPITELNRLGIYPETRESIFGMGLKFPFEFIASRLRPATSTATSADVEHVNEAIFQILGTKIGDRFMLRGFGSRLHELLFEPLDQVFRSLAKVYTIEALGRWEKRITIRAVTFDDSDHWMEQGLMPGEIRYRLIQHQVDGNLVYPYARTPEGARLVRRYTSGNSL